MSSGVRGARDRFPWSAEARVLVRPARVFREVAREPRARGAAIRRPMGLLFAVGAFVSILASGRFSVRLILDGAVSFAFVIAIEVVSLWVVVRAAGGAGGAGGRGGRALARDVDAFFIGQAPWLLWMAIVGAAFGVVSPRHLDPLVAGAQLGALVPVAWSLWIDFHFCREILRQAPGRACRLVLLNRAIAWTAAIGIFLGIAIWSEYAPRIAAWMGR